MLFLIYYSWEEIMNRFDIDKKGIQVIKTKFQDDFYDSESDFETE